MYITELSAGGKATYDGKVSSICTYVSDTGKTVWVGECKFGFLYGFADSDCLRSCRYLSICFRFAHNCSDLNDLREKAQLTIDKTIPLPEKLLPEVAAACCKLEMMSQRGVEKVYDIQITN